MSMQSKCFICKKPIKSAKLYRAMGDKMEPVCSIKCLNKKLRQWGTNTRELLFGKDKG